MLVTNILPLFDLLLHFYSRSFNGGTMSTPNSESLASSESDFGTKYSQIIDYTEQIGMK
jgi:hypothetical protein